MKFWKQKFYRTFTLTAILAVLGIIIGFTACFSEWKGEGIITINLGGNSRSAMPWPPQEHGILGKLEYVVTLSGNEVLRIESKGGNNIRASVSPGRWSVKVDAYYLNQHYGTGKKDNVIVYAGQNNSVTVQMTKAFYDGGIVEMVQIPEGTLTWGNAVITLTAFKMGKFVVTQEQYQEVMGINPSYFNGGPTGSNDTYQREPADGEVQGKRPVEYVTWLDAIEFCNKLSKKEELTPVYEITGRKPATGYPITVATVTPTWTNNGYRLPTDAQWEYACRAGTTTNWYFGDDENKLVDYAWYIANASGMTHEVGKKEANKWGLYDMHGNVWEWCWDLYGSLPSTNETDYKGAVTGSNRVLRGGSCGSEWQSLRSASRDSYNPVAWNYSIGFRLVRP